MKNISLKMGIIIVIIASILSIPTSNFVFRVDDWDFINELNTLSFIEFMFKPNPAGQFNPLWKAVYGSLLMLFHYNNLGVALFNYCIGIATLIVWMLILRHLKLLTLSSVLFLSCIRLSYVGIVEEFLFPLLGGADVGYLCFSVACYLILVHNTTKTVIGATTLLIIGIYFGANCLLASIPIPLLYYCFTKLKTKSLILSAVWVMIGIFILIPKPSESNVLPSIMEFGRYFFAITFINGTLGGLAPNTFPGVVHALFFVGLLGLSGYSVFVNKDWQFRFLVCTLLATQILTCLAVSITRAHHGVAHAGSYRYVFMNVFLQLLILSLVASKIKFYLPLILVLLAIPFAIKSRLDMAKWETGRIECLNKIINSESTDCLPTIYYRDDPNFIIETQKFIR